MVTKKFFRRETDPVVTRASTVNTGVQVELPTPTVSKTSQDVNQFEQTSLIKLTLLAEWHRRLQRDHQINYEGNPRFGPSGWYNALCKPCFNLDLTPYDKKICGKCCRFSTFKSWVTTLIISSAVYILLYMAFDKAVLPGGTYFFIYGMFILAYFTAKLFYFIRIPSVLGPLFVGVIFGNLPIRDLPSYSERQVQDLMAYIEKIIIVIMVVRGSLQIDFQKMKGSFWFILAFSLGTFLSEFLVASLGGYFLLGLPIEWSVLHGAILSPVSLSTVVSFIEKYSDSFKDTSIGTVIVAASALEIVFSLYAYSISVALIFAKGFIWVTIWWSILLSLCLQVLSGLVMGVVLGFLAGMFPDRRSINAPYGRIAVVGLVSVSLVVLFHANGMTGVGVLASITLSFIAKNFWEYLGWHDVNNPVFYFYGMLYFLIQPAGISLVGYTFKYQDVNFVNFGLSAGVVTLCLLARELVCFLLLLMRKSDWRERTFLGICSCPKGTAEALLATALIGIITDNQKKNGDEELYREQLEFARIIINSASFGILFTAPVSATLLTYLAPRLLRR